MSTVIALTDRPESLRLTLLLAHVDRPCVACGLVASVRYAIPVDDTFLFVEPDSEGAVGAAFTCSECARAYGEGGLMGLAIRLRALSGVVPGSRVAPVIGEAHA